MVYVLVQYTRIHLFGSSLLGHSSVLYGLCTCTLEIICLFHHCWASRIESNRQTVSNLDMVLNAWGKPHVKFTFGLGLMVELVLY